jgi:large subunit ribosomal protein L21
MYAVIETGGKQYRVTRGEVLRVDKLTKSGVESGGEITLDRVLLAADGGKVLVGRPVVEGASVRATVVDAEIKSDKVTVFKSRRRKRYRRLRGHRQRVSAIRIEEIILPS